VRSLVAALVLAVTLLGSPDARAETAIAVLCDEGDRFGLRVVAELEALGFRAVILDPLTGPPERASLEAAARRAGVAWMPSEHVGAAAFVAVPLSRPKVDGAAGSADLSVLLAGLGARFLFTTRASTWAPSIDLGVMAVSFRSAGTARPGFPAGESSAATAAPFARLGAALAPAPRLRLRADLLCGAVAQGVSLRAAGQELATWGRPLFLASGGVDFGWF